MLKKILISGLLICCLMAAPIAQAFSVEQLNPQADYIDITPRFLYVNLISALLVIDSNGIATSYGNVQLNLNGYNVMLTCELQRYVNGGWSTLKTWTASGSGYTGAVVEGYQYVTSGYTYRTFVTATVKDSSGKIVETVTCDYSKPF